MLGTGGFRICFNFNQCITLSVFALALQSSSKEYSPHPDFVRAYRRGMNIIGRHRNIQNTSCLRRGNYTCFHRHRALSPLTLLFQFELFFILRAIRKINLASTILFHRRCYIGSFDKLISIRQIQEERSAMQASNVGFYHYSNQQDLYPEQRNVAPFSCCRYLPLSPALANKTDVKTERHIKISGEVFIKRLTLIISLHINGLTRFAVPFVLPSHPPSFANIISGGYASHTDNRNIHRIGNLIYHTKSNRNMPGL